MNELVEPEDAHGDSISVLDEEREMAKKFSGLLNLMTVKLQTVFPPRELLWGLYGLCLVVKFSLLKRLQC